MRRDENEKRHGSDDRVREAGMTLVELLIVVAIIGILAMTAIPALKRALLKSKVTRLANDARVLERAFMSYHADKGAYPSTSTAPTNLNLTTLDPLVSNKYLVEAPTIMRSLQGRKITAYDSPNVNGNDTEYWAVLTLAAEPQVQVVVCDTSGGIPGYTGKASGTYFLYNSRLLPIDGDILGTLGM